MEHQLRIKQAIEERKAVIVVGTGVSIMATENAPCVTWKGLLEDGKTYCVARNWWDADRQQAFDLMMKGDDLMIPAQMIRNEFVKHGGAHDHQWLRAALGDLVIKQPAILDALHGLSAPLITLNYDPLLELGAPVGSRYDPITPKDQYLCAELLRGNDRTKILHLHGYYDRPETVILDPVSYGTLLNDQFTEALRKAMGFSRTMIYVGCGGTFEDPHFQSFRRWMTEVCKDAGVVHYRLVLQGDLPEAQRMHQSDGIEPVVFGQKHPELVDFLRSLAPSTVPDRAPTTLYASTSSVLQLPARPSTFGRDREQEELVAAILQPTPRPICISAPLGYGKSNLCLAALHHPDVEAVFGPRRIFLRLDAAYTAESLVLSVALALGLAIETGADAITPVIHELGRNPAVLVLDNFETPWEPLAERTKVEQFIGLLSNVKGLVLVVSIRGRQLPGTLAWQEPVRELRRLAPQAALEAFLDIAPEHANHPQLGVLIGELHGWPLPIVLMAHQARGVSLRTTLERWQTEKTRMLERGSASSTLDSLHISIAASMTSPRITQEGKRLLRAIAELPDGVLVSDVVEIGFQQRDARNVIDLGLVYEEKDRFRVLPGIRSYLTDNEPLDGVDREALTGFFLTKLAAELGRGVGGKGGREAIARLKPEAGNIEHLLMLAAAAWRR